MPAGPGIPWGDARAGQCVVCVVCVSPRSAASTQGTGALGRVPRRLLVPGKDFREQEMTILIGEGGRPLGQSVRRV